jgi:HPt (histidine-containing phosphotransfer) domain-containing protein
MPAGTLDRRTARENAPVNLFEKFVNAEDRPARSIPHREESMTAIALLDREHLDRQTFGDPDLRAEIVAMFRDQAAEIVRAIEAATGSAAVIDLAHRLKGSARALGAFRLAEAAQRVEAGDSAAIATLAPVLAETLAALAGL